ncbi:Folate receptor-like [Trema orientale]|uniref:Folate receptor-like n=1 Tax=Trema orientale TaxID=63057 RepID=A0A2P5BTL3_TREOI|nr:Folate receptor-like [Trema orientale]
MGYASLILLLLLDLFLPFSSGKSDGLCISQGGRFPPFSSEGKPPKKVSKGPKDLTLCRVFRQKTCCDVAQTHPALLNIRKLASTGEASQECLQLWELLECSICDPLVGVQPRPPIVCTSFCDRVFKACSDAYFSMETMTQVLSPCGVNDFVCGRASQWVHNGTDLCHAAGFAVKDDLLVEETSCYGGKASLDLIADSWKASRSVVSQKGRAMGVLDDFHQWVTEMPFSERVSWAVGGMVLTAGLLFLSKRKSHSQRQKLAAIQRTARKLEAQMNQNYPGNQGNKKASKR